MLLIEEREREIALLLFRPLSQFLYVAANSIPLSLSPTPCAEADDDCDEEVEQIRWMKYEASNG